MAKIFIPNKGPHDYKDAQRFGELVYITEGFLEYNSIGFMYRKLVQYLNDSQPDDYLLVSGLPLLNLLAGAILGRKHGKLNLLLYRRSEYLSRTLMLDNLLENALSNLDNALENGEPNNAHITNTPHQKDHD